MSLSSRSVAFSCETSKGSEFSQSSSEDEDDREYEGDGAADTAEDVNAEKEIEGDFESVRFGFFLPST